MTEKFNLSWNEFESCASNTFKDLLSDKDFTDVTLACDDGKQIQAHKVILSSCSPMFNKILKNNPHQHPLVYLNGIRFSELQCLIKFIYLGQTEVEQDYLEMFMKAAIDLQIKGLCENQISRVSEIIEYPLADKKPCIRDDKPVQYEEGVLEKNYPDEDFPIMTDQNEFELISVDTGNDNPIHLEKKHRNGKFPCEMCGYEATRADSLKSHIMAKHEGVKYDCKQCAKSFSN